MHQPNCIAHSQVCRFNTLLLILLPFTRRALSLATDGVMGPLINDLRNGWGYSPRKWTYPPTYNYIVEVHLVGVPPGNKGLVWIQYYKCNNPVGDCHYLLLGEVKLINIFFFKWVAQPPHGPIHTYMYIDWIYDLTPYTQYR